MMKNNPFFVAQKRKLIGGGFSQKIDPKSCGDGIERLVEAMLNHLVNKNGKAN